MLYLYNAAEWCIIFIELLFSYFQNYTTLMVNFGMDYTLKFEWIYDTKDNTKHDFVVWINDTAMKPDFDH